MSNAQSNPDNMTPEELLEYLESPDFARRSFEMRKRVEAGESMTLEHLAAGLGLPFMFFAGCLAKKMLERAPGSRVLISNEPVRWN